MDYTSILNTISNRLNTLHQDFATLQNSVNHNVSFWGEEVLNSQFIIAMLLGILVGILLINAFNFWKW